MSIDGNWLYEGKGENGFLSKGKFCELRERFIFVSAGGRSLPITF